MHEPLRHQFLFGRGMVSDDTEHACMVAQSLIAGGRDESIFTNYLANRMRLWLLALPAGVGLATLKAILRLCAGVPSERSGPAMELLELLTQAVVSSDRREPTDDFATSLGLHGGVSGYMYNTVPIVIHAWLINPSDFRTAINAVVRCGGDTDTTAAIVGGIVGAAVGKKGIPREWLDTLWEWPRCRVMRCLCLSYSLTGSGSFCHHTEASDNVLMR